MPVSMAAPARRAIVPALGAVLLCLAPALAAREVPDAALDVLAQQIARDEVQVSGADLAKWIVEDRRGFALVDVRPAEHFAAGHVKGAVNVALPRLFRADTIDALANNERVVLYGDATERAAQAAAVLRLAGVNAYALRGGYVHWVERTLDPRAETDGDDIDLARRQAMARSLKDCPRLPVAPTVQCETPAPAAASVAAPPGPATVAEPPGPATIAEPPGPSAPPGAAPAVPIILQGGCG